MLMSALRTRSSRYSLNSPVAYSPVLILRRVLPCTDKISGTRTLRRGADHAVRFRREAKLTTLLGGAAVAAKDLGRVRVAQALADVNRGHARSMHRVA